MILTKFRQTILRLNYEGLEKNPKPLVRETHFHELIWVLVVDTVLRQQKHGILDMDIQTR